MTKLQFSDFQSFLHETRITSRNLLRRPRLQLNATLGQTQVESCSKHTLLRMFYTYSQAEATDALLLEENERDQAHRSSTE